jgi:hypothetical protein
MTSPFVCDSRSSALAEAFVKSCPVSSGTYQAEEKEQESDAEAESLRQRLHSLCSSTDSNESETDSSNHEPCCSADDRAVDGNEIGFEYIFDVLNKWRNTFVPTLP